MANPDFTISSMAQLKVGSKSFEVAGDYDNTTQDFSFSYPPAGKPVAPNSYMSLTEFLTWAGGAPLNSPISADDLPPQLRTVPSVLITKFKTKKKGKDYAIVVAAQLGTWDAQKGIWAPASWTPIPDIPALQLAGFSIEIKASFQGT